MLVSRKSFLMTGIGVGMAALCPVSLLARASRLIRPKVIRSKSPTIIRHRVQEKKLWVHNAHTGETVKEVFWANGQWNGAGCRHLDHVLRDHRSGQSIKMSPQLLILMHTLAQLLNHQGKPLDIISGYRCAGTNALLRKKGTGVAKNSYHTKGMAVDIAFRGLTLQKACKILCTMGKGGVGMYQKSGFVHMDVRGCLKSWRG